MMAEQDLTVARFNALLGELGTNRSRLLQLAEGARRLALPDATRRVADVCLEVLRA